MEQTRICKTCKEEKALTEYWKHPTCELGRLHECAECSKRKRKEKYVPKGPCKDNPSWFKKGHKLVAGSEKGWIKPGQRISPNTEFKEGNKPHNFVDGKSDEINRKTFSKAYLRLRLEILSRDKYCCRRCGKKSDILHVHHIVSRRDDLNKMMDKENLITVCPKCHVILERESNGNNKYNRTTLR